MGTDDLARCAYESEDSGLASDGAAGLGAGDAEGPLVASSGPPGAVGDVNGDLASGCGMHTVSRAMTNAEPVSAPEADMPLGIGPRACRAPSLRARARRAHRAPTTV